MEEGLRKLRGMVVFPAEETTRGYSCYSGDYADYAAHLHNVKCNMSYQTYKLHRLRGQDDLHLTTRDYALQARGYASTLAVSRPS